MNSIEIWAFLQLKNKKIIAKIWNTYNIHMYNNAIIDVAIIVLKSACNRVIQSMYSGSCSCTCTVVFQIKITTNCFSLGKCISQKEFFFLRPSIFCSIFIYFCCLFCLNAFSCFVSTGFVEWWRWWITSRLNACRRRCYQRSFFDC